MRILHTSDWHLGRIFHGIHLTEDQAYVLDQFVDMVKDVRPDIVLVAGDIFDRSVPPTEAVNLLDEVVSRILLDYNIPILMISGNHDSPDRLGFGYRLLQDRGFVITGRLMTEHKPFILKDEFGEICFHSIPYVDPAMTREKLQDTDIHTHEDSMNKLLKHYFKSIDLSKRNILVTHAFVAGGDESESERPLTVGGTGMVNSSIFKDFDYVALGHLHRPQSIGTGKVRYSGSLMKYSFSEANHKKEITMIEMGEKGTIRVESMELKPKRDLRCIEGYLGDILKGPQNQESKEDYLMVTLKDEGAILDAMGKLRKVYPNALHIERPMITPEGALVGAQRDFKNTSEVDLFASFINQVTSKEITELQREFFSKTLTGYYNSLRGE